jgi:hypothetical protein
MIESNLILESHGWLYGSIQIDKQVADFEVSYIGSGISILLKSLIEINPDLNSFFNAKTPTKTTFNWVGEPWGYEWKINFKSFEKIVITIINHTDLDEPERNKSRVIMKQNCNYFEFATAFVNNLTEMIKKHGIVGYNNSWGSPFPIIDFLEFKHYLKNRSRLQPELICGLKLGEVCSSTYKTNLEHEISFLTEII